MSLPLVTVIVPTTHDRKVYNDRILSQYIQQDYHNKHLLYDFGPEPVGYKRNRLSHRAMGEIIVAMDSDDHYAKDWITRQVKELLDNNADVTGLKDFHLYDEDTTAAYRYTFGMTNKQYIAGATMCYRKSLWERNPFPDMKVGEDAHFIWNAQGASIHAHNYTEGFVATIHSKNTSKKLLHAMEYSRCSEQEEERIRKWVLGTKATSAI